MENIIVVITSDNWVTLKGEYQNRPVEVINKDDGTLVIIGGPYSKTTLGVFREYQYWYNEAIQDRKSK